MSSFMERFNKRYKKVAEVIETEIKEKKKKKCKDKDKKKNKNKKKGLTGPCGPSGTKC